VIQVLQLEIYTGDLRVSFFIAMMYQEPHLQKLSDKCAMLWKNWYNYKYGLKDEKKAERYRKLWGKCVDQHTKMCEEELKRNPKYKKMIDC